MIRHCSCNIGFAIDARNPKSDASQIIYHFAFPTLILAIAALQHITSPAFVMMLFWIYTFYCPRKKGKCSSNVAYIILISLLCSSFGQMN